MFEKLKQYFESIKSRDPAATSLLLVLLTYPGVKAVFFHRIANFIWGLNLKIPARMISQLSRFLTGMQVALLAAPLPRHPLVVSFCM
mgnify:CR=1 FL=1